MGTIFLIISIEDAVSRNGKMKPGWTVPSPLQWLSPDLHQGEAGTSFGNLKHKGVSSQVPAWGELLDSKWQV